MQGDWCCSTWTVLKTLQALHLCVMSAILHSFQLELTPIQAEAIRKEWLKVAAQDRAMLIIQPVGMTQPDHMLSSVDPVLNVAIFDEDLAHAINRTLIAHKKDRP